MIGRLIEYKVTEEGGKQVVDLKIRFPLEKLKGERVGSDSIWTFLKNRAGYELGIDLTTIEGQQQSTFNEVSEE